MLEFWRGYLKKKKKKKKKETVCSHECPARVVLGHRSWAPSLNTALFLFFVVSAYIICNNVITDVFIFVMTGNGLNALLRLYAVGRNNKQHLQLPGCRVIVGFL